jgi:hypothetical protein
MAKLKFRSGTDGNILLHHTDREGDSIHVTATPEATKKEYLLVVSIRGPFAHVGLTRKQAIEFAEAILKEANG